MVIVLGTEDIEKTLGGQLLNFTINHSKKKNGTVMLENHLEFLKIIKTASETNCDIFITESCLAEKRPELQEPIHNMSESQK